MAVTVQAFFDAFRDYAISKDPQLFEMFMHQFQSDGLLDILKEFEGTNISYGDPVQDVAALKAVVAADRTDKQLRFCEDKAAIYGFDSASTAVPTLDRKNLFKIPVRNCPPTEQHQIVQEIETRLSVCDKVEQSITESLVKAKALRQSILKKAFEGRLLSEAEVKACKQEKDYEPASVLLEKIKVEKLAKEQEQKKKNTKKKSRK